MLGGERRCRALVSLDDCTQDRGVLFPIARLTGGIHRREQHGGPLPKLQQEIPQHGVLPRRGEFAVKLLVQIEKLIEPLGRDRRRSLVQDCFDALDDLLVLAARRQSGIMSLQQRPHLDRFARLLLRHRRDSSPLPCSDLDEALGSERADCLAHGVA